jgi:paired amphipathic helix protein Sin3a
MRREEPQIVYISLSDYEVFVMLKLHLGQKWNSFLKLLDMYNNRIIGKTEFVNIVREMVGGNTKVFNEFRTKIISRLPARRKLADIDNEDEEMAVEGENELEKDGKEGDGNGESSLNVSYRMITEEEKKEASCSGRDPLCNSVLNDNWAAPRPSISPMNPVTPVPEATRIFFEKIMECEDARVELDLIVAHNRTLGKRLEELLSQISNSASSPPPEVPEQKTPELSASDFNSIHRQSIRTLYGDKSEIISEGLYKHPLKVIPIILNRLHQKEEEWKALKASQEEQWKRTMEENYLRSLDYKMDEWKEEDSMRLDPDFIIKEAKEKYSKRKKRQEEGTPSPIFFLPVLPSPYSLPLTPSLSSLPSLLSRQRTRGVGRRHSSASGLPLAGGGSGLLSRFLFALRCPPSLPKLDSYRNW